MNKSDVEMEDAQKLHDDSGNNNQESEIDARAAHEEEVPCAAAVSGDANGMEHGEEDTIKCRDEDTEKMNVKAEVIDQTNPVNEASEINVGSDSGIVTTKSEHKEIITETEIEAQRVATSSVEKRDVKTDVVDPEATDSGVKENEPVKNDAVDGNHGEEVIITETETEAQCAGVGTSAVEKQIDVKDEVVEREATIYELNQNEPIKNDVVDGNHGEDVVNTETETEAQHAAIGAVEKQIDVKKEVVDHEAVNSGLDENEPTKNDVDGNHGEDVINTATETEAQHAATGAVEKQNDIKKEVVEREATNSEVNENESTKNDVDGNDGEDVIVTATETEAQGAVEKDIDAKNEVECEATNSGVNENEHTKNNLVDGTHGVDMEKIPAENVLEKKLKEVVKDAYDTENVAGETMVENAEARNVPSENRQLPTDSSANKDPQVQVGELDDVQPSEDEEMEDAAHFDQDKMVSNKEQRSALVSHKTDGTGKTFETVAKPETEEFSLANQHEAVTPTSLVRCSSAKAADNSGETAITVFTPATLHLMGEDDDGTPEDQAAFMKELEHFYRQRTIDFKPPKFYGQPLNCLKLWRAVIRLGGYDRVTGSKLWRQVGESFHPPKTCTTVSWTFRIFYEKSLLEYERHKTQSGEVQLPIPMLPEVSGGDGEGNGHQGSGPGSGRARRDSAARAMQGWHAQRLGAGEGGEPNIKDKNLNNMAKNEKNLKSIGSLKQKRPNEVEHSSKAARTDISKQLVTTIVDVGPPADWVKINVRQTKECFEVYALVPGLLREEVRVQSDPAGRLVITGQPEQVDNPWGITPFKKVVSLPARIDPVQTSAVVSLHGRLFVRVPLEQPNI